MTPTTTVPSPNFLSVPDPLITTHPQGTLCPCLLCGKELRESTTGRYPHGNGYIWRECRDEVGEQFCKAMDEYEAPRDKTVDDPIVGLLHLL